MYKLTFYYIFSIYHLAIIKTSDNGETEKSTQPALPYLPENAQVGDDRPRPDPSISSQEADKTDTEITLDDTNGNEQDERPNLDTLPANKEKIDTVATGEIPLKVGGEQSIEEKISAQRDTNDIAAGQGQDVDAEQVKADETLLTENKAQSGTAEDKVPVVSNMQPELEDERMKQQMPEDDTGPVSKNENGLLDNRETFDSLEADQSAEDIRDLQRKNNTLDSSPSTDDVLHKPEVSPMKVKLVTSKKFDDEDFMTSTFRKRKHTSSSSPMSGRGGHRVWEKSMSSYRTNMVQEQLISNNNDSFENYQTYLKQNAEKDSKKYRDFSSTYNVHHVTVSRPNAELFKAVMRERKPEENEDEVEKRIRESSLYINTVFNDSSKTNSAIFYLKYSKSTVRNDGETLTELNFQLRCLHLIDKLTIAEPCSKYLKMEKQDMQMSTDLKFEGNLAKIIISSRKEIFVCLINEFLKLLYYHCSFESNVGYLSNLSPTRYFRAKFTPEIYAANLSYSLYFSTEMKHRVIFDFQGGQDISNTPTNTFCPKPLIINLFVNRESDIGEIKKLISPYPYLYADRVGLEGMIPDSGISIPKDNDTSTEDLTKKKMGEKFITYNILTKTKGSIQRRVIYCQTKPLDSQNIYVILLFIKQLTKIKILLRSLRPTDKYPYFNLYPWGKFIESGYQFCVSASVFYVPDKHNSERTLTEFFDYIGRVFNITANVKLVSMGQDLLQRESIINTSTQKNKIQMDAIDSDFIVSCRSLKIEHDDCNLMLQGAINAFNPNVIENLFSGPRSILGMDVTGQVRAETDDKQEMAQIGELKPSGDVTVPIVDALAAGFYDWLENITVKPLDTIFPSMDQFNYSKEILITGYGLRDTSVGTTGTTFPKFNSKLTPKVFASKISPVDTDNNRRKTVYVMELVNRIPYIIIYLTISLKKVSDEFDSDKWSQSAYIQHTLRSIEHQHKVWTIRHFQSESILESFFGSTYISLPFVLKKFNEKDINNVLTFLHEIETNKEIIPASVRFQTQPINIGAEDETNYIDCDELEDPRLKELDEMYPNELAEVYTVDLMDKWIQFKKHDNLVDRPPGYANKSGRKCLDNNKFNAKDGWDLQDKFQPDMAYPFSIQKFPLRDVSEKTHKDEFLQYSNEGGLERDTLEGLHKLKAKKGVEYDYEIILIGDVDKQDVFNWVFTKIKGVDPEQVKEEDSPKEDESLEPKPNDKSPKTKSPETKSPETKSPETKSPETKSPANEDKAAKTTHSFSEVKTNDKALPSKNNEDDNTGSVSDIDQDDNKAKKETDDKQEPVYEQPEALPFDFPPDGRGFVDIFKKNRRSSHNSYHSHRYGHPTEYFDERHDDDSDSLEKLKKLRQDTVNITDPREKENMEMKLDLRISNLIKKRREEKEILKLQDIKKRVQISWERTRPELRSTKTLLNTNSKEVYYVYRTINDIFISITLEMTINDVEVYMLYYVLSHVAHFSILVNDTYKFISSPKLVQKGQKIYLTMYLQLINLEKNANLNVIIKNVISDVENDIFDQILNIVEKSSTFAINMMNPKNLQELMGNSLKLFFELPNTFEYSQAYGFIEDYTSWTKPEFIRYQLEKLTRSEIMQVFIIGNLNKPVDDYLNSIKKEHTQVITDLSKLEKFIQNKCESSDENPPLIFAKEKDNYVEFLTKLRMCVV